MDNVEDTPGRSTQCAKEGVQVWDKRESLIEGVTQVSVLHSAGHGALPEAEDAMAGGRERRREREREEESERKDKKKKFAVLLSRLFLPLVVSPPSQHTLFVDNVLLCLLAPGSRVLLRLRRERALRREQSRCHAGRGLCSVTLFKKSDANGRQMYCGPIIILSLSLFLFQ